MPARIETVASLVELERVGWKYEPATDDEVKIICPVHDDTSPSASLNVKKNLWKCHVCNAKGDVVSLLAHILKVERATVFKDLSTRYDLSERRAINPAQVEKYHGQIWDSGPLLQALRDRGLDNEMIRKHRLGYHNGRITIPIYDSVKNVVNIRRYLPGAPGPEKMKNTPGYGSIDVFMPEQLHYKQVVLCGGECKSIVSASLLNREQIGAVATTAGEGNWDPRLNASFKGKIVYICYDIDAEGLSGARKVAAHLVWEAESVYIVRLPLDKAKHPKGDINDWVMEGASTTDFLRALGDAERFVIETEDEVPTKAKTVKLGTATDADNVGHVIETEGVVSAVDTTPYIVPRLVAVACSKDQDNCPHCPVKPHDPDPATGKVELEIKGTSSGILDIVGSGKKDKRDNIRQCLGIPSCKVATFTIRSHYNVSDARVVPQLSIHGDNTDHIVQPAMIVGDAVDLNTPYNFRGRVYPHPKTQQAVLLFDDAHESEDSLTSFTPDKLEDLKIFQPKEWTVEGLRTKLNQIYHDLETNVSRIYHRRELHLAVDLTYYSVLYIPFDKEVVNGWTNCLIAGDSSQGKSEVTQKLMNFYGLGVKHECKNASVAGLLGGVQQLGNRWFASWGIIPTHDRRLVILEEIKGTPTEVLGKLTDMRSSGIAEITKIEKRRAHARTRLIMVSNPRSDRQVSQYSFGIEIIKELVGSLEDVRRFDFAILVSADDVDPTEINKLASSRPTVKHKYTKELCRKGVLWAWTLKPNQIEIGNETMTEVLKWSTKLCEDYSESIPLLDRGTVRYKLARLATALAARTYSEECGRLIVRPCHVEFVYEWLHKMYSSAVFGYADFSKAKTFMTKLIDEDIVRRQLLTQKYPKDLVEHMLHMDKISLHDICDWCELDKDDALKLLGFLIRKHALYRERRMYVKSSQFIGLLKQMKLKGLPAEPELGKERF